jgi:glutathione S-transferase-like protein
MAVKLHRCSTMWLKINAHPCWRVQKALDEQGIEYEVVQGPIRRGKRDELDRVSGQRIYPAIEFEDGTAYRAESKEMAARIKEGKLFEGKGPSAPAGMAPEAGAPPTPPESGGPPPA